LRRADGAAGGPRDRAVPPARPRRRPATLRSARPG